MAAKGRPSTFKPQLFEAICQAIEEGTSQQKACDKHKVKEQTFRGWLKTDNLKKSISARYARAREQQIHGIADRLRDRPLDFLSYWNDEHGNKRLDPASVQLAKLAVDTDKFLLAKLLSKIYGDNVEPEEIQVKDRERRKFILVPMSDSE